jgi:hypothetical protein
MDAAEREHQHRERISNNAVFLEGTHFWSILGKSESFLVIR